MKWVLVSLFGVALLLFGACNDGQRLSVGLSEPLRVAGGQFFSGPLPGAPPGTTVDGAPTVTIVSSATNIISPGLASLGFDGRTSDNASSVAVRFADLGSGYWVFVLSGPDSQFPGELVWHGDFSFNSDFASQAGKHPLRFVAIDANGNAGEQYETTLCLETKVPDNLHTCAPTQAPPDAVIALEWDQNVDIDLEVVTPDFVTVDAKHPTTAFADGGTDGCAPPRSGGCPVPGAGYVDRDSLLACVPDGIREEDLVWDTRPSGTYDIYVNLFDGCGKPGASWILTVYEAQGDMPNRSLVPMQVFKGRVAAVEANGGSALGTYIYSYSF